MNARKGDADAASHSAAAICPPCVAAALGGDASPDLSACAHSDYPERSTSAGSVGSVPGLTRERPDLVEFAAAQIATVG